MDSRNSNQNSKQDSDSSIKLGAVIDKPHMKELFEIIGLDRLIPVSDNQTSLFQG